jgi:hypothetical protein
MPPQSSRWKNKILELKNEQLIAMNELVSELVSQNMPGIVSLDEFEEKLYASSLYKDPKVINSMFQYYSGTKHDTIFYELKHEQNIINLYLRFILSRMPNEDDSGAALPPYCIMIRDFNSCIRDLRLDTDIMKKLNERIVKAEEREDIIDYNQTLKIYSENIKNNPTSTEPIITSSTDNGYDLQIDYSKFLRIYIGYIFSIINSILQKKSNFRDEDRTRLIKDIENRSKPFEVTNVQDEDGEEAEDSIRTGNIIFEKTTAKQPVSRPVSPVEDQNMLNMVYRKSSNIAEVFKEFEENGKVSDEVFMMAFDIMRMDVENLKFKELMEKCRTHDGKLNYMKFLKLVENKVASPPSSSVESRPVSPVSNSSQNINEEISDEDIVAKKKDFNITDAELREFYFSIPTIHREFDDIDELSLSDISMLFTALKCDRLLTPFLELLPFDEPKSIRKDDFLKLMIRIFETTSDNTPMQGGRKRKKYIKKKKVSKNKVRKIHKGPRGGKYYITKGRKVYL